MQREGKKNESRLLNISNVYIQNLLAKPICYKTVKRKLWNLPTDKFCINICIQPNTHVSLSRAEEGVGVSKMISWEILQGKMNRLKERMRERERERERER